MKRLLSIILLAITLFSNLSYGQQLSKKEIEVYILQELSVLDAHMRICEFQEDLCLYSAKLLKEIGPKANFMFYAIVKYESGNFRYRRGIHNKNDYGLPMINSKVWTISKLRKFGFNIRNHWQLVKDDKLALHVGFTIFWYNLVLSYKIGNNNQLDIKEFLQAYHSPRHKANMYAKRVYRYYVELMEGILD